VYSTHCGSTTDPQPGPRPLARTGRASGGHDTRQGEKSSHPGGTKVPQRRLRDAPLTAAEGGRRGPRATRACGRGLRKGPAGGPAWSGCPHLLGAAPSETASLGRLTSESAELLETRVATWATGGSSRHSVSAVHAKSQAPSCGEAHRGAWSGSRVQTSPDRDGVDTNASTSVALVLSWSARAMHSRPVRAVARASPPLSVSR